MQEFFFLYFILNFYNNVIDLQSVFCLQTGNSLVNLHMPSVWGECGFRAPAWLEKLHHSPDGHARACEQTAEGGWGSRMH